ncbi:hypothetical protein DL89DRAFT_309840, partial [Linderina pennispora]
SLFWDQPAQLETKNLSLTQGHDKGKASTGTTASADVTLRIRGISSGKERHTDPIVTTGDHRILEVLATNRARPLMPHINYKSQTRKSAVSTAIYLALYPLLLSLWLLRQLIITRQYLALAHASEAANFIMRLGLFVEHLGVTLVDNVNFGGSRYGTVRVLFLSAYSTWRFIGFFLFVLPQRRVANALWYHVGSQIPSSSKNDRGGDSMLPTLEGEAAEKKIHKGSYAKSTSMMVRVFVTAVVVLFVEEYVYNVYSLTGSANPSEVELILSRMREHIWKLSDVIQHVACWWFIILSIPSIMMAFGCKSGTCVPVAYQLLRVSEFAVIGAICFYETPKALLQISEME